MPAYLTRITSQVGPRTPCAMSSRLPRHFVPRNDERETTSSSSLRAQRSNPCPSPQLDRIPRKWRRGLRQRGLERLDIGDAGGLQHGLVSQVLNLHLSQNEIYYLP